jgi:general secretion pathway protein D
MNNVIHWTKSMEYLYRNTKRIVYVSSLALAMVGCTGLDTKGSNKDETVENSVSSKIEKVTHQQEQIDVLIQKGDSALKASNFLMAESIFNDVLEISPDNLRALEGLYRLELYRSHESELEKAISLLDQGSESSNAEASLLLRGILVENPQNSRARSIYNDFLIKKENKRLQSMAASIKYTQPVTLEFRNTELSIVIEALSKGTKVNFMLDNDVKKNTKVSIFVKNITLESAIEMLVQSNGLRKKNIR